MHDIVYCADVKSLSLPWLMVLSEFCTNMNPFECFPSFKVTSLSFLQNLLKSIAGTAAACLQCKALLMFHRPRKQN